MIEKKEGNGTMKKVLLLNGSSDPMVMEQIIKRGIAKVFVRKALAIVVMK